jgi:DNA-binding SARP family transcriptional activator/tetratricopeptide (TPR) repeat protein
MCLRHIDVTERERVDLDFLILGSVEVRAGAQPLRLSGPRQQRTLAGLLVDADRVVSLDRLVDVVWDEAPPSTARRQVQDLVTRLRRSLAVAGAGSDTIVTTPGGYMLRLDGHRLDAARFSDLVAASRREAPHDRAAAAATLRTALALWRGPALAGMTAPSLAATAAAWNERRLEAWEEALRIDLTLGRHREIIAELTALVAQHPYRETLAALLMTALNQAGRTAEALRVYDDLRQRLAEQLGVDPGESIRQMHLELLRSADAGTTAGTAASDPGPSAVAVPAQLPANVSAFTGRAAELARLDRLLPAGHDAAPDARPDAPSDARPGSVVIVAITGTAGVGKTALALHWAHRVRAAFPDGQLYADLGGYAGGRQPDPLSVLAWFLHALGVAPEQVPQELDEAAGLYRSLLAGRRVLVVCDNAGHVSQVRPLLPGSEGCLALVTSRDALTGLVARDGAERVGLDALRPTEAQRLLGHLLGPGRVAAEQAAVAEMARLCDHLPLALRIAAAILAGHPGQPIADYVADLRGGNRLTALQVDGDKQTAVRAAFDLSYRRQATESRRVFRLLGLAPGPDVTAAEAAALAGLPIGPGARLLQRLAAAHMIGEPQPGRYAPHDLLRLYAEERAAAEDSPADRAAALDRLYGYYLGRVDTAARLLYPEKLRLPSEGYPQAEPDPGFAAPASALAWLDAHRPTLVAAVVRAAAHGPRRAAWLLADALRGYFWLRMHTVDWHAVAAGGRKAAESEGDLAGQAAAELSLADAHMLQADSARAIRHYRLALALHEQRGSLQGRSAVLGNLGNVYWRSGRLQEAADHFAQGLALDREIGWIAGQAVKLGNLASVYRALGQLERCVEHHLLSLALDHATGSLSGEAVELSDLGEAYHALGHFDRATDHVDRALRLNREVGDRASEAESLRILAGIQRDIACGPATLQVAHTALDLARDTGERRVEADVLNTVASIHHRLGNDDLAIDHHQLALDAAQRASSPYTEAEALVGLAEAHTGRGEYERAMHRAEMALAASRHPGFRMLEGQARTARAAALLGLGRAVEAAGDAEQALAIQLETGHRLGQARSHLLFGRALRHLGKAEAADAERRAHAIFAELGVPEATSRDAATTR